LRTRIIFSLKNRGAYVPFHHQYLLAQVIKGLLVFGQRKDYVDYTHFNFSGLKGQTKVSRKGLHYFSSKVTLVFACQEKEFHDYLLARLFEQKDIVVGNRKVLKLKNQCKCGKRLNFSVYLQSS
jgi:CRISPR-associated endoribonuclease Cas6